MYNRKQIRREVISMANTNKNTRQTTPQISEESFQKAVRQENTYWFQELGEGASEGCKGTTQDCGPTKGFPPQTGKGNH